MRWFLSLLLPVLVVVFPTTTQAQVQEFFQGTVTEIVMEQQLAGTQNEAYVQELAVQIPNIQQTVSVTAGSQYQPLSSQQRLRVGQTVIVSPQQEDGTQVWVLVDSQYRLPYLGALVLLFFLLVLIVARGQGALSILAMIGSLLVLTNVIIPQILSGVQPVFISVVCALIIGSLSMYLSHGWSLKSHIALTSMVITLTLVAILSTIVMRLSHMNGMGSEEAVFLQLEPNIQVNLRGLFLAGIVLGALGVLDDITVSQVSIVKQLYKAKPSIRFAELFGRAMQVGKDHIASLVNTLVLAYAASSLPLFLLLQLNNTRPLWVMLNDEMIAEEVVRTITGSIGLVLAVPLTTFLAATIYLRRSRK